MANYLCKEYDFKIESGQMLLKFIIEPFGRCFRPGNFQIYEMSDGALTLFWNQGLLIKDEVDLLQKVGRDEESVEDIRKRDEYRTLCREMCPIMTRIITEEERDLLDEVLEMNIPMETKAYDYHVRDCGSVSMILLKNGIGHTMEGLRVLPEKWKPFVILANTITDNCGVREEHRNELFVHTPAIYSEDIEIETPLFLKDLLK